MPRMWRIRSWVGMGSCVLPLIIACTGRPLASALVFSALFGFRMIIVQIERKRYWADKQPTPESAFLASLEPCTPEQLKFCLAVRKRIARSARVSEQLINAEDILVNYILLDYDEPDEASIKKILKELGRRSTVDYLRQSDPITLGDFLKVYLQNWDKLQCVPCK